MEENVGWGIGGCWEEGEKCKWLPLTATGELLQAQPDIMQLVVRQDMVNIDALGLAAHQLQFCVLYGGGDSNNEDLHVQHLQRHQRLGPPLEVWCIAVRYHDDDLSGVRAQTVEHLLRRRDSCDAVRC